MEDGNRLGKTAVRCMALHLRMMRLHGNGQVWESTAFMDGRKIA